MRVSLPRSAVVRWLLFLVALGLAACGGSPTPTVPPELTSAASPTPAPPPSPTPLPDARAVAEAYLTAWTTGQYAAMHALLAAESRTALPVADFEQQYRTLLDTLTAVTVTVSVTGATETGDAAQASAHARYETALVGPLETDLTLPLKRENGLWRVVYSPTLIWPELTGGQQLLMVPLIPDRGDIYDRNDVPLAQVADAYAIGLVPGELTSDANALFLALGDLLTTAPSLVPQRYEFAAFDQYFPMAEAPADLIDRRYGYLADLPGVYLTPYTARFYAGNGLAAHVTGYTSYIQADEVAAFRARGYYGVERVGRTGLEAWGEPYLAGRAGGQLQLRDANNQFVRMVAATEPVPAQDVVATIDYDLQAAAQFALNDLTGAIVVMDLHTGAVLALASTPTFSPNLFEPFNRNAVGLNLVLNDPRRPLLNHAAQSTYPAGSVFKLVTLAAGLTSGLFTPETTYFCTGEWNETNDPALLLRDWKEGGHGELTLQDGLSASCNPWFYHIGYALFNWDPRWLSDTARAFGLGQRTQTQIDESPGLIPDPDWKQQTRGETWNALDATNLSIGQGDVLVTPLQMARLVAAIANGGQLLEPQFVNAIRPQDGGGPTYTLQPIISGTLPLDAEQIAALQAGMINVTKEPLGTARNRFRGFRICVAGKTGTAEDPGLFGQQDPDAWFAGYTCAGRADRPDIAVAVVVQNQGQGSDYAAPIFRRVLEAYFGLPYTRYPWEQTIGVPQPTPTPTDVGGAAPADTTPTP